MLNRLRPMVILTRLTAESMGFALQSVRTNKLRTLLSLFGITIGIFSIISVFTVVDSLEISVHNSLNQLGSNTIYVQKWPWNAAGEYPWWKYMNRPEPNQRDLDEIRRRSQLADASCLQTSISRRVEHGSTSVNYTSILGVSDDCDRIQSFDIAQGRYFTNFEATSSHRIAIIGHQIAQQLFGENASPVGEIIKIDGHKFSVVGVFSKEGNNLMDESNDERVVIPMGAFGQIVDIERYTSPFICVKPHEGVGSEELIDELRGILRSFHRINPADDDNFSLNVVSMFESELNAIFSTITLAGGVIAFFSILVGGFGIANIMFVSVKERTNEIGIQKALGAKRYIILTQFLFESMLLSTMGGIIGLLLIFILTLALGAADLEFEIILTASNIAKGMFISIIIGIIAGFIPAWQASKLSPLTAINTM